MATKPLSSSFQLTHIRVSYRHSPPLEPGLALNSTRFATVSLHCTCPIERPPGSFHAVLALTRLRVHRPHSPDCVSCSCWATHSVTGKDRFHLPVLWDSAPLTGTGVQPCHLDLLEIWIRAAAAHLADLRSRFASAVLATAFCRRSETSCFLAEYELKAILIQQMGRQTMKAWTYEPAILPYCHPRPAAKPLLLRPCA